MSMPEVSVVIPSYNHARFICQAVDSVLSQTLSDLELIVVDDGSRDNSLDLLRQYKDPRMRVIVQENQGAHAAINRGMGETSGEFLTILNSDDFYASDRLEKLVAALRDNPHAGLACSHIQVIGQNNALLGVKHGYHDLVPWMLQNPQRSFRGGEDLRAALLTENYCATTSNYVFTRTWYRKVGSFRPLRYAHDWDFALRLTRVADLILVPEPLVNYRIHANNTIRENQAAMIFEICWILSVHLPQSIRTGWFKDAEFDQHMDQLLYSIYTYGFDRVLSILLLLKLDEDETLALQVLEQDHPIRKNCLAFIGDQLRREAKPEPHEMLLRVWRMLRRIKRAVLPKKPSV